MDDKFLEEFMEEFMEVINNRVIIAFPILQEMLNKIRIEEYDEKIDDVDGKQTESKQIPVTEKLGSSSQELPATTALKPNLPMPPPKQPIPVTPTQSRPPPKQQKPVPPQTKPPPKQQNPVPPHATGKKTPPAKPPALGQGPPPPRKPQTSASTQRPRNPRYQPHNPSHAQAVAQMVDDSWNDDQADDNYVEARKIDYTKTHLKPRYCKQP